MTTSSDNKTIEKILIIGGGSAGWMTAAALSNSLNKCQIELVESDNIPTVGVGEATIPPIKQFNHSLGIDERQFMAATQATFKLGIQFENWAIGNDSYFHPFGTFGADFDHIALHQYWLKEKIQGDTTPLDDYCMAWAAAKRNRFGKPAQDRRLVQSTMDYAYHFDAALYAEFLRNYSERKGVSRTIGTVKAANKDPENGYVTSVLLENGRQLEADFFIDCSGFKGLLIEEELNTGYEHWNKWLPCDRAVAVQSESNSILRPYTKSIAHDAGWSWRIPLQNRTGNGSVYSSQHLSDDKAAQRLLSQLDTPAIGEPKFLQFKTGHRKKFWNKNVVSIGLSAGFMEPLESTSLHLIQTGITRFLSLYPNRTDNSLNEAEYNRITKSEYEGIRDFLILHYHANKRPEEFWEQVASMEIPENLRWKMEHFKSNGRLVSHGNELFANPSWLAVYIGQDVFPSTYDPIVDERTSINASRTLAGLKRVINESADALPTHAEFISRHCPSQ